MDAITSGRPAAGRARLYLWLFLAGAALNLLASGPLFPAILHGNLLDPDSYMRLVRIEQGLKLGHLVNVVHRDDSGVPLVIEWSRLFDAAIVALAAPLAPFLGWHRALVIGGLATGPLSMGALCAALGFAAAPLTDRRFLWGAVIAAPLIPGLRAFGSFGVIHYHILQPALLALALGCALRAAGRDRSGWGAASGAAAGFAIWLTPETMPFVLLIEAGLGGAWLFRPLGRALTANGAGFLATIAAALLLDPPHGGVFAVEVDRLSIVYLVLGIAVCATTLALAWLDRLALAGPPRRALGIGAAILGFGVWLALYPTVALGPYALMPVADMHIFFDVISEARPVTTVGMAVALLGPGAMAFAYALWRLRGARPWGPASIGWAVLALAAALATGLTARMVIFQQFPAAMAAGLLPVALEEGTRFAAGRRHRAALTRVSLIAAVLLVPSSGFAAPALLNKPEKTPKLPGCSMRHIAPLLAPAAGRIVLTAQGDVPELLYRTRIIGVGSLYQHGIAGYKRAWVAWRSPAATDRAPRAVAATRASFVLFCKRAKTYPIGVGAPADALWTMLGAGRVPPWLRKVGADPKSGFLLYRIVRPSAASGAIRTGAAAGAKAIRQPSANQATQATGGR